MKARYTRKKFTKAAALLCAVLIAIMCIPPVKVQAATVTLTLTVQNWDGTVFDGTGLGKYVQYCTSHTVKEGASNDIYNYANSTTRENGIYVNGSYVAINASGKGTVTVTVGSPVSVWYAGSEGYTHPAYTHTTTYNDGSGKSSEKTSYSAETGIDWKNLNTIYYANRYQELYVELGNASSSSYSSTVKMTNRAVTSNLTVTAKDSVTGTGIQGVVYSTTNADGGVVTATTNASGVATLKPTQNSICTSSYTFAVSEASMPKGFKKSGTSFSLSANVYVYKGTPTSATTTTSSGHVLSNCTTGQTGSSKTLNYTYDSALDVSKIFLKLQDTDTGDPIRNGQFSVSVGSTLVRNVTTNISGEAIIDGLDNATYTIKQTATDANYNINTTAQTVIINKADAYVTHKNTCKTGTLNLKITDSAGAAINGAKFILSGNGTNTTYTTNSSGAIAFSGIRYGTYTVNEYEIPSAYVPKNLSFALTLNATTAGGTYTYTYNKVIAATPAPTATPTYKLYITLQDTDTGEPVRGSGFDVLSGSTVLRSLTTNASGEAVYDGIVNGTYTVKQTTADGYYTIAASTQSVTVSSKDAYVTFKNARKTGTLNLKITDSAGAGINGVKFILNGNGKNTTYTTNASGSIAFSSIRYGTYTVNEYEMPAGYIAKNLSVALTLDASTAGSTYTYAYSKTVDTAPPAITFAALPAENTVSSFTQTLTLKDDSSGVKELKINDVSVYTAGTQGTLSTTYNHVITANGTYKYALTDYAGNVYTATQTVKSILYKLLQISDPVLINYKTSLLRSGSDTYVVNASYSYSNIAFDLTGENAGDGLTYRIELKGSGGTVYQQINKSLTVPGSVMDRLFYQNSTTGTAVADGEYTIVVTAKDKYSEVSKSIPVIVKRNAPPRPVITYSSNTATAAIDYPSDLFETHSLKQYTYTGDTQHYTGSVTVTKSGTITATYTDLAGNKSTAMLSVTPPRATDPGGDGSSGGIPIPTPAPGGSGGSGDGSGGSSSTGVGTGSMMDETMHCIIYYVNLRGNNNDPNVINAILNLID